MIIRLDGYRERQSHDHANLSLTIEAHSKFQQVFLLAIPSATVTHGPGAQQLQQMTFAPRAYRQALLLDSISGMLSVDNAKHPTGLPCERDGRVETHSPAELHQVPQECVWKESGWWNLPRGRKLVVLHPLFQKAYSVTSADLVVAQRKYG
jgi:hypothetical protein